MFTGIRTRKDISPSDRRVSDCKRDIESLARRRGVLWVDGQSLTHSKENDDVPTIEQKEKALQIRKYLKRHPEASTKEVVAYFQNKGSNC